MASSDSIDRQIPKHAACVAMDWNRNLIEMFSNVVQPQMGGDGVSRIGRVLRQGRAPQDGGRPLLVGRRSPPPQASLKDGSTPPHDGALQLDVDSYREAVTRERLEAEADKVRGRADPFANNACLFWLI